MDNVFVSGASNGDLIFLSTNAFGGSGGSSYIGLGAYGTGMGGDGVSATAILTGNAVHSGLGQDRVELTVRALGERVDNQA